MSKRTWSWGPEIVDGGVSFRVFAPKHARVEVTFEDGRAPLALEAEGDGWFSGVAKGAGAGTRYTFRLADGQVVPDAAARFSPEGPHGASEVVDLRGFPWTDQEWRGAKLEGQVLYEMHVGTFTPEGTLAAAMRELPRLKEIGITTVELLPLAEFPGSFGWGYDGVQLYAPTRLYGRPEDLCAFVDRAHALGLAVVLDLVVNHLGPDGNWLCALSDHVFAKAGGKTDWGDALDYWTEPGLRAYFAECGAFAVATYHLDGLRLDATQAVRDESKRHLVTELVARAREAAAPRSIVVFAETEPEDVTLAMPEAEGGYGCDAIWSDDFHHVAKVAATGRRESYFRGMWGTAQELASCVRYGLVYNGQHFAVWNGPRGSSALDRPLSSFVFYLENHDQVSNGGRGARLTERTSPGRFRAMTTLLCLAPATPLFFQGQERGARAPFVFFADHGPDLAKAVSEGRRAFLETFASERDARAKEAFWQPHERSTFERCVLRPDDRREETEAMTRELLALRQSDRVFASQGKLGLAQAVLAPEAFVVRYGTSSTDPGDARLLIVNLGPDLDLATVAEPLLAPPADHAWELLASSEDPRWGGGGTPPEDDRGIRTILGHSALVLTARPRPART